MLPGPDRPFQGSPLLSEYKHSQILGRDGAGELLDGAPGSWRQATSLPQVEMATAGKSLILTLSRAQTSSGSATASPSPQQQTRAVPNDVNRRLQAPPTPSPKGAGRADRPAGLQGREGARRGVQTRTRKEKGRGEGQTAQAGRRGADSPARGR